MRSGNTRYTRAHKALNKIAITTDHGSTGPDFAIVSLSYLSRPAQSLVWHRERGWKLTIDGRAFADSILIGPSDMTPGEATCTRLLTEQNRRQREVIETAGGTRSEARRSATCSAGRPSRTSAAPSSRRSAPTSSPSRTERPMVEPMPSGAEIALPPTSRYLGQRITITRTGGLTATGRLIAVTEIGIELELDDGTVTVAPYTTISSARAEEASDG
ncbi:hypothetical protein ACGFJT_36960 [Actinomadura geliboluensis]|uniref:hypothetical protein n=1 Tax=Actinomadura geliboluensis TaxID=882440 RepID=UPI00371D020B